MVIELFLPILNVILDSIKYHISAFAEHMLVVRVTVTKIRNVIFYKYIDNQNTGVSYLAPGDSSLSLYCSP